MYDTFIAEKNKTWNSLRLGQTGKQMCYGGKSDKTCRIWLSGDKIHLL